MRVRNSISWQKNDNRAKGSQHAPKKWGTQTDTLFFYVKSDKTRVLPYRDLTDEEELTEFPKVDAQGRRYKTGIPLWRQPSMGDRPNLCYTWRGFTNPHPSGWRLNKEKMEEEHQKGNIVILNDGRLERRLYLDDYKGKPIGDLWLDISPVKGKQRTDYPTQKPLALLERIIEASSNPGDMVLDPFCGCATTCVAAEKLNRQWVGIDISPKAADLVKHRISKELGFTILKLIHRFDIPSDRDGKRSKNIKHILYGMQEGKCNGCLTHFPFQNFEVDHIIPKSKGGSDTDENLQLLCGHCNRVKGDRTQEYLVSQVRMTG